MIRIVTKCLTKSKIEEQKWDWHPACFHFKKYKNSFLNGKPLKPWSVFRNGDVIEIIKTPNGFFSWSGIGSAILSFLTGIGSAASGGLLSGPAAAVFGGVIAASGLTSLGMTIASIFSSNRGGTTASKEYSSSTQPELRGASNDISDGIVPVVFGRTQQTPSYGQLPYRLVADGASTNKYRQYFIADYNNVVFSDYKLGDTSVNNYSIDYLDIITASGSNNFIGFDNVKAENIDEELSYNSDEEVNQNAHYDYNELTTTKNVSLNFRLRFSNVDINAWCDKKFKSIITVLQGENSIDLTKEFIITKANLTKINDNTYTYDGSVVHNSGENDAPYTEIVYTQFAPLINTRGNSTENTNELDSLYVSETLITDTLDVTSTLNLSINKYAGTVSEVVSTSPENTKDIDIIISFPQGLFKQKNDGSRASRGVTIEIMYKEENGTYKSFSDGTTLYIRDINGQKQPLSTSTTKVKDNKVTMYSPSDLNLADQLFYRTIGFSLPEKGKYTVRVRSADFADKTNFDIGYPRCSEIQYYVDGKVLDKSVLPKVNQIAFEALAYKGLSGTLKKFNYIAEARIPVWNGENWDTVDTTQNPAAIVRYILTDKLVNPRAISLDYIDNITLVELYNWCEEKGYKACGVIGETTKIFNVLNEILKNCQGAMIPLLNGKHTFAIDSKEKTPKFLFNQHNCWNFSWTPSVGRLTEAIRASYINNKDYTEDELTVYWYDGKVHEEIKAGTTDDDYLLIKKDYKYVNDRQSVLNIAKYELEAIQTKRNSFEFDVNLEAMNMTLLDRGYVQNSSNMHNESSGLIKNLVVNDNYLNGFELYSDIDIPENATMIVRSLDYINEEPKISVLSVKNSGRTNIVEIEPVHYDGIIRGKGQIQGLKDKWEYDGDLFTLGTSTFYDVVITDIKYNEDNTATITCRDC